MKIHDVLLVGARSPRPYIMDCYHAYFRSNRLTIINFYRYSCVEGAVISGTRVAQWLKEQGGFFRIDIAEGLK